MSDYYILDGHKVVPCDLMTWAAWLESNRLTRTVKRETVGESDVSTVFLGLDHNYFGGPPHIFETMVFGGPLDQEQERCSTWDEAEAQHAAMIERVTAAARDARFPAGEDK